MCSALQFNSDSTIGNYLCLLISRQFPVLSILQQSLMKMEQCMLNMYVGLKAIQWGLKAVIQFYHRGYTRDFRAQNKCLVWGFIDATQRVR